MIKLTKWFAGFFEDQKGSASSKRGVLYMCMFFFYMIIKGSLEGKVINSEVLYMITGIILFCIGAVTSEYFAGNKKSETN